MTCCPTCGHEIEADSGLVLDEGRCLVSANGQVVKLSAREFAVVKALHDNHPRAVSTAKVYEDIYWLRSSGELPNTHIIEVFISKARQKLRPIGVDLINRWGTGAYTLEIQSEAQHVR